ncbi:MAG TPA: nickel-binding protein [Burkholderiaceae bacterium]|nr:nickel-binding protein [Burkholderiaceae bacterium]
MKTFAVQRALPGITSAGLANAQRLAIETAGADRGDGSPVRYIRTNFYPATSQCTCLFEAETADAVLRVNRDAGLPFERIEEVLDLDPQ